jgi:hypothetical protein
VAAAAAVAEHAQSVLHLLANLRDEINLRLTLLGCERKSRWIFLPDPSAPGYDSLLPRLIGLANFIEIRMDVTGVLADRGLGSGDASQRGSVVRRLESLRDEITRRRAAVGLQRGLGKIVLPGPDGSRYGDLLEKLIELMNIIQKALDQAESWPIEA